MQVNDYSIPKSWESEKWYQNHVKQQLSELNDSNLENKTQIKAQILANQAFVFQRDVGEHYKDSWACSIDPKRIKAELQLLYDQNHGVAGRVAHARYNAARGIGNKHDERIIKDNKPKTQPQPAQPRPVQHAQPVVVQRAIASQTWYCEKGEFKSFHLIAERGGRVRFAVSFNNGNKKAYEQLKALELNVSERDMEKGSYDTKNKNRALKLLVLAVHAGAITKEEAKKVEQTIQAYAKN